MTSNEVIKSTRHNLAYKYQFDCGILKMVGPKMQDLCQRINMLKGKCFETILQWIMVRQKVLKLYFQRQFICQKLGKILENKVVQILKLKKNVFYKKWSPKLILIMTFFWKKSVDFCYRKLTLKVQFQHFLTNHNSL